MSKTALYTTQEIDDMLDEAETAFENGEYLTNDEVFHHNNWVRMKKVGDMKLYSFEELLEEDYGKIGTPERDAFESSVDEAVQAYRVGEAIKQACEA